MLKKLIIMEYLVFPFGKYKGTKLEDLPSTYIVLALEKFELPGELVDRLKKIILGRFNVFKKSINYIEEQSIDNFIRELHRLSEKYEPKNV